MAEWIWIHLLQRKQGLWYELPCGLHAEIDVLRGAAIQLIVGATRVGAHTCTRYAILILKAGGTAQRFRPKAGWRCWQISAARDAVGVLLPALDR